MTASQTRTNSTRNAADLAARRGPAGHMQGPVQREKKAWASLKRIGSYLHPWRKKIVFCVVMVAVSVLAALLAPWLHGLAIDRFIARGDRGGLARIAMLLVALYVSAWGASILYSRMVAVIAQQAMAAIRRDLGRRLQSLSMRFFDRNRTGDLMSRVSNDVDALDQMLSQTAMTGVWAVLQILSLVVVMSVLDWRLTITALAPVPAMMFFVDRLGRLAGPAFSRYQRSLGNLNAVAEERLAGQRTVIALSRQQEANEEFAEINEATRSLGIRAQVMSVIVMPLMFGIGNLSTVSVVGVGAWLAVSGRGVTVGLMATFVVYASRIGQPFARISGTIPAVYAALAGARRVFELLDEETDVPDADEAVEMAPMSGRVCFDNVSFAYTDGQPVLSDVSFQAQPGETIGLVGPTGAGKSTIINVLCRFYDIDSGSVTLDGRDIRDVTKASLRRQLGVVLQHTFLFTDSVRENIRFGRLDATDEEVEAAAHIANAHSFIRALPSGYDTIVSEGGSNLSLGQRQLLAIARVALANPALLILDEATSSVDTRTEAELQSALLNLMEGRTSFVIAHRLSTVRHADLILVIEDGRITESGTHDELLELNGFYADSHRAQFRGQIPTR